nr:MAG TPA: hypothetical protein [Caudoviricetes sp.]
MKSLNTFINFSHNPPFRNCGETQTQWLPKKTG